MVTVEVPRAFTDGSSRMERVFVPHDAVAGKSEGEALGALQEAMEDPLHRLRGADLDAPVPDPRPAWLSRLERAAARVADFELTRQVAVRARRPQEEIARWDSLIEQAYARALEVAEAWSEGRDIREIRQRRARPDGGRN